MRWDEEIPSISWTAPQGSHSWIKYGLILRPIKVQMDFCNTIYICFISSNAEARNSCNEFDQLIETMVCFKCSWHSVYSSLASVSGFLKMSCLKYCNRQHKHVFKPQNSFTLQKKLPIYWFYEMSLSMGLILERLGSWVEDV